MNPDEIDIACLPKLKFSEKSNLPAISAVYFILDDTQVLYIGGTKNLFARLQGSHHVKESHELYNCDVAWFEIIDTSSLTLVEDNCIRKFTPLLNQLVRRTDKTAIQNAIRQKRYRERRKANAPILRHVTKTRKDKRSRVQRWQEAVEVLRDLQAQYQDWLDNLPESLQDSTLAEKLQAVCELDIDELDVDLPKGFGRD